METKNKKTSEVILNQVFNPVLDESPFSPQRLFPILSGVLVIANALRRKIIKE